MKSKRNMKLVLIFVAVMSNNMTIWGAVTGNPAGVIAGFAGLSAVWLWFEILEKRKHDG